MVRVNGVSFGLLGVVGGRMCAGLKALSREIKGSFRVGCKVSNTRLVSFLLSCSALIY